MSIRNGLRWCVVIIVGLCCFLMIGVQMRYMLIDDAYFIVYSLAWIIALLGCVSLAMEGLSWLSKAIVEKFFS